MLKFVAMNLFTEILLDWYKAHKRELPWRDISNPYLIWISEIILQQTRISQGIDYYRRFVARFPDVASLAAADEEEVMRYWQGLGYYSRARNLHAAARSMTGGVFPSTYEGVRSLKGVGDYTAAAICSFAYGMPLAVVDGNVYRVLSRYWGIDVPIDSSAGKRLFSALAQEMMDTARPADYNQAIMDFGAIQCTPSLPSCGECPLLETCFCGRRGNVTGYPVKKHEVQVSDRFFTYIMVYTPKTILVRRRLSNDIWKGLYELPMIESDAPLTEELLRHDSRLLGWVGKEEVAAVTLVREGVRHVLTHRIIHADFYLLPVAQVPPAMKGEFVEIRREELDDYAFPRLIVSFLEKIFSKDLL